MYKIKYLKYKNKYIEFKKQLGGSTSKHSAAGGSNIHVFCKAIGCKTCILPTQTEHPCFICKTRDSNHLRMMCPLALAGCQTPGCTRKTGLWVCMECGFIGCGRLGHGNKHAENHYKTIGNSTTHNKMIEIATQKVWDYNPPFNKFMGILSNNAINFDWGREIIENKDIIETGKITSSTISIIWNGKLLCGLRGVGAPKNPSDKPTDKYYGYVYTQGGSIDDGETPLDTAIREAKEEAGIDISLYHDYIKTLGTNYEQGRIDFYCIIPNEYPQPIVKGPEYESQWEILQVNNLAEMFESDMILNTGLSWVSIDKLVASEEEIVKNSPSIKNLKKIIASDVQLFFERPSDTEMTLYIAGDKASVGKSSVCYGILSTLVDIYHIDPRKLAYIKPVTQSESDTLITKYCETVGIDCVGKGPVIFYSGFTRAFLKGETKNTDELKQEIVDAVNRIKRGKTLTIIDGVGYPAVGSICGISNAVVASLLKSPVLLVGKNGVGDAVDSFNLNRIYFESCCVKVLGSIFNKFEMSGYYSLESCKETIDLYFRNFPQYTTYGYIPKMENIPPPPIKDSTNLLEKDSNKELEDLFKKELTSVFSNRINIMKLLNDIHYYHSSSSNSNSSSSNNSSNSSNNNSSNSSSSSRVVKTREEIENKEVECKA